MRIAVFGYYNALNAGDDHLQQAITYILKGSSHEIYFLPHYIDPPTAFLKTMDWILIGGGGLVFSHHGIWVRMRKWLGKTKANVGVLGLGVSHLPPVLAEELDSLLHRCSFFYVRDKYSWELLGKRSEVAHAPDLTWSIPLEIPAGISIPESHHFAISLAPCHWKPFDPDLWMNQLSLEECVPFPLHCDEHRDVGLLRKYFPETPNHFSMLPLLASQYLIGARFHSLIFAIQLGKPFIAIAYDYKVREICRELKLERYCLEPDESHRLNETIHNLKNEKLDVHRRIREFDSQQRLLASQTANNIREIMRI